jgi:hypothetical protein
MQLLKTNGVAGIEIAEQGTRARFFFDKTERDLCVDMPSHSLFALLPILSKAVAAMQTESFSATILAANVHVSLDCDSELILEFENTAGAKIGFHVPQDQLLRLLELLDAALHQTRFRAVH